ncbi:MAG: hypothetical protein HYY18_14235 [Planctomycetes bacterium]|nr:hypothetical protein [Planctomycetota bacterium]
MLDIRLPEGIQLTVVTQTCPDSPADSSGEPIATPGPDPRPQGTWDWLCHFWEQWRLGYLFLAVVFALVWQVSAAPIPTLDDIRWMGGLHPIPVLLLMDVLGLMWVPPLVAAVLYAASFGIPRLNTAGAVALSGLCAVLVLALVLMLSLVGIIFVG